MIKIFNLKESLGDVWRLSKFFATHPDYIGQREDKALEELAELMSEIIYFKKKGEFRENFYKEASDVVITLLALMIKHDIKKFIFAMRIKAIFLKQTYMDPVIADEKHKLMEGMIRKYEAKNIPKS